MSETVKTIDPASLARLKADAEASDKRRARLNLHGTADDPIQEMLIAFCRDCLMPPHRNRERSESVHIVEGEIAVPVFDAAGKSTEILHLVAGDPSRPFLYRMQDDLWHTLVPLSEHAVVHEIILGPFTPGNTEAAAWAPAEGPALRDYLSEVLGAEPALLRKFQSPS